MQKVIAENFQKLFSQVKHMEKHGTKIDLCFIDEKKQQLVVIEEEDLHGDKTMGFTIDNFLNVAIKNGGIVDQLLYDIVVERSLKMKEGN